MSKINDFIKGSNACLSGARWSLNHDDLATAWAAIEDGAYLVWFYAYIGAEQEARTAAAALLEATKDHRVFHKVVDTVSMPLAKLVAVCQSPASLPADVRQAGADAVRAAVPFDQLPWHRVVVDGDGNIEVAP